MYSRAWKTAKKWTPVDLRVVLYGVSIGLCLGALNIGEPTEDAAALGISVAVQVTIGLWLGLKLSFSILHIVENRLESFGGRIAALKSRLGLPSVVVKDHKPHPPVASFRLTIVAWCIYITPIGIILLIGGAVGAIIDLRVNVHTVDDYSATLLTGAGIALVGLAGQCACLLEMSRTLTHMERRLEMVPSIDGITLNADQLGRVLGRTYSIAHKVAGERHAA